MTEPSTESALRRFQAKVVVLTALQVEYDAVRSHLEGDCAIKKLNDGTIYEVGRFEGEQTVWTVAVAEIGAGNETTAIEATKAIGELRPNLLMFVGVAGSLKPKDAPHGSVVVAETVHAYHGGKDSEKFVARPQSFRIWHRLSQLVKLVARRWSGDDAFPVRVGAIAAGNVVVASSKSKTYELIRRHYNDAIAVEMESAGLYAAAEGANRLPVLSVRGISDCVDDKTADADVEWQPIAARNAAAFAFAMLGAIGPEDIGSPPHESESSPSPEAGAWASLPFSSADLLQCASESHQAQAARLFSALSQGQPNPKAAVDVMLLTPPQWLLDANSGLLWGAIGEFAASHNLHSSASDAFDKAAEAGGDTAMWLALSAFELSMTEDGSSKALEKLTGATSESQELPIPLVRAVVELDTQGILDLTRDADGKYLRPTGFRVRALQIEHRIPEAIDLAQRLVDRHPGAAGYALILAQLLIQGAQENSSSLGFEASLMRARELALTARDLRRGWGGDSVEPTLVAGTASLMLHDAATALHVVSLPPEGSVLPSEATDDLVMQMRVDALLFLGRREEALSEAAGLSDDTLRGLVEADCLSALGRKDRAEERYVAAIEALESASPDDREVAERLHHGLFGLAELAVFPLPSIDRLRAVNPEAARKIEIFSDIARGESKSAIQGARKSGRPEDVPLLVEALTKAGQADDALSVLKDAAERFGRTEYLLRAVNILAREQRFAEAYDEAVSALAIAADGTPLKAQLRKAAVETAAMVPDWQAVRTQAKAAIAAGDSSEGMRWALVIALNNTLAPEDALAEATVAPALIPRNEQEARLLMSLHSTSAGGLDSIAAVLDIAEAYPTSEEIGAAAFFGVVMLSKDLELPEDMRERLSKASENFFERYPDSSFLRRIEGTPEKIIEFLEASGDPWSVPAVREVVERIGAGALPLPLLADVANKPYAELLVKRGIGWTVGESRDPGVQERERATAVAAIGHSVVLETSAVYGAMITGLPLDTLLGLFPQTVVAQIGIEDAIRSARDLALRSTSSLRWDFSIGSAVLDETTPDEADRWAREADEIERVLRVSTSKVPVGRGDAVSKAPLILQPVQLAKELGLALYSDDVALRLLAASEGVPAFGTASLLGAAEGHQLLEATQLAEATDSLRRKRYADLDWGTEDLLRIAEQEEFQPIGGASGALARPSFWADPAKATSLYRSVLDRLAELKAAPEVLEGWHAAATSGFLGFCDPAVRRNAAGGLLAVAFLTFGLQPAVLPYLLNGTRQGSRSRGVEDPFPDFCRGLADELSILFGETQGGRMYVHVMQQLTMEDRAVALRELLTRKGSQANGGDLDEAGDA